MYRFAVHTLFRCHGRPPFSVVYVCFDDLLAALCCCRYLRASLDSSKDPPEAKVWNTFPSLRV